MLQLYSTSLSSRIVPANSDETPKGDNYMAPHVLAMSATPIPRTLALALYGDVSLTQVCNALSCLSVFVLSPCHIEMKFINLFRCF